jgi:Mrp family chromosome partitioning ATPase
LSQPNGTPSALHAALKWRRPTVLAWMLGIALPVAIALYVTAPTFVASAEVLLPVTLTSPTADVKTSTFPVPETFIDGQVKLLTSDRIVQTTMERLGLWNDAEIAEVALPFGVVLARSVVAPDTRETYRAARIAQFRNRFTVTSLAPAPAIRVSYTSKDPYKAAAAANGLVRTYIETYKAEFGPETGQAESTLAQRLTTLQEHAAAAAQAVVEPAEQESRRRQLEATVNVYRALYETTLAQYSEAVRAVKPAASEPRVVSAAIALRADGIFRLAIMGLALGAGGLIGVASAVRREAKDRPVRSLNDISASATMPALATVSLVPGRKLLPSRMRAPPLLLHDDQDHLRALLLRLRRGVNVRAPFVLGVTSASRGEGKTTVAFNLGVLAAEGGARVLLADLDLHTCALSKALIDDGQSKLLEAIRGKCDLEEAAAATEHGFDVLGERALDDGVRPVALLASQPMDGLLARAREQYDIVICDLPPVLDHADISAMADAPDFFLFVVEWGRTPAPALERALQCLPLIESRLLGAVLNKAPFRS